MRSLFIRKSSFATLNLGMGTIIWLAFALSVTAQNAGKLSDWADLISFRPSADTQTSIQERGTFWKVHPIERAKGQVNLDYYPVTVSNLPTGFDTPEQFLHYIRLNINKFVDTGITEFSPYSGDDSAKWTNSDPSKSLNAVISIDLKNKGLPSKLSNIDDASVVVSKISSQSWVFSTIRTGGDFSHPVSGNREFGFTRQPDGSYTFFTRGADRLTTIVDERVNRLFNNNIAFSSGDETWRSFQRKLAEFVESKNGKAKVEKAISNRHPWEAIRTRYYKPTRPWVTSIATADKPLDNKATRKEIQVEAQEKERNELLQVKSLIDKGVISRKSLSPRMRKELERFEANQKIIGDSVKSKSATAVITSESGKPPSRVTVLRMDGSRSPLGNNVPKGKPGGTRDFLSSHPDLHSKILAGDLPPEAKSKPIEVTDGVAQDAGQIPRGWIVCQCPGVHLGLGIVHKGVRYHANNYSCP